MAILEVTLIKKESFHDKSATSSLFLVQAHEKALPMSQTLVCCDLRICRIRLYYVWRKKKKDNITLTKLYACCCFTFSHLKVSFIVGVSITE